MYRQIAEDLRRQIEAGDLQPGSRLGTELELRGRQPRLHPAARAARASLPDSYPADFR